MLLGVMRLLVLAPVIAWAAAPARSASIHIENASFEAPAIDPCGFPVLPYADQWRELDLDKENSTNTGVFANTPPGSPDRVLNADGNQLAFLGSARGNAFEQDLVSVYEVGCAYRLTVGVGASMRFPPSSSEPFDMIELVLYYLEDSNTVDIVHCTVAATGWSSLLQDFWTYLPTVQAGDDWAGKNIGVAIRATGSAGGFWVLDNVRLTELPPAPDFTGDYFVNLEDFAVMAKEWLSCTGTTTDLTGNGCVNVEDLMILVESWLATVQY
jgi:hypothetical protein